MRRPRVRVTVGRLAGAVALAAVALAGVRLGYPFTGVLVSGVTGLALLRTVQIADRYRRRGIALTPAGMRRDFVGSLGVVLVILAVSSAPVLFLLPAFWVRVGGPSSHGPSVGYDDVAVFTALAGLVVLPVAWLLRRAIW